MLSRLSTNVFASLYRMIFRSDHRSSLPSSQPRKALSSTSLLIGTQSGNATSAVAGDGRSRDIESSASNDHISSETDNLIGVIVDAIDSGSAVVAATAEQHNLIADTARGPKHRKLEEQEGTMADSCNNASGSSLSKGSTSRTRPNKKYSSNRNEWKSSTSRPETGGKPISTPRMNHFVAFRVSDSEVIENVANVQDQMMNTSVEVQKRKRLEVSPGEIFRDSVIPTTKLHFTLHVMELKNDDQIQQAIMAVQRAWESCQEDFLRNPIKARIEGLDHFTDTVLFAKMQGDDTIARMTDLANRIREEFELLEIPGESWPFNPHMTIAKIQKSKTLRNLGIRSYPRELWKHSEFVHFGYQRMEGIQLLSMMGKDPSGYYPVVADYEL